MHNFTVSCLLFMATTAYLITTASPATFTTLNLHWDTPNGPMDRDSDQHQEYQDKQSPFSRESLSSDVKRIKDEIEDDDEEQEQDQKDENEEEKWVLDEVVQHRKRGFSMLARWKPFNTFSRQRTSIRNAHRGSVIGGGPGPGPGAGPGPGLGPAGTEYDIVSAETRALYRPSGQPLRWG